MRGVCMHLKYICACMIHIETYTCLQIFDIFLSIYIFDLFFPSCVCMYIHIHIYIQSKQSVATTKIEKLSTWKISNERSSATCTTPECCRMFRPRLSLFLNSWKRNHDGPTRRQNNPSVVCAVHSRQTYLSIYIKPTNRRPLGAFGSVSVNRFSQIVKKRSCFQLHMRHLCARVWHSTLPSVFEPTVPTQQCTFASPLPRNACTHTPRLHTSRQTNTAWITGFQRLRQEPALTPRSLATLCLHNLLPF